ncbi:hypothetical protein ACIQPQ_33395 [Streptomyces sp. NPDC091281]|uniref:hypothetical protein n=1 Tax=Streptomyces sp. NPDC091281 TaxID=3365985 RepID=UPI003805CE39
MSRITVTVEATPMQPATVKVGRATVDAVALLPLPTALSERQLDGHVCVWGGEALSPETAVGLGRRRVGDRTAFPRACTTCLGRAAQGVLFDHSTECSTCQGASPCDTGRALYRVIRAGNR